MNFFSKAFLVFALMAYSPLVFSDDNKNNSEKPQHVLKKFAVIDLKRIVNESKAAKSADKEVKKIQKSYIAQIDKEEANLKKRESQLLNQKKAMSEEAFAKKVQEFQKRVQKEKEETIKKRRILEAAYIKSLDVVKKEVTEIAGEIAIREGFDFIIPKSQLLFYKGAADISDEVLNELNKRLEKVNIDISRAKKK